MAVAEDTEDRSLEGQGVQGCSEDSDMVQEVLMALDHLAGLVITDREVLEDMVLTEARSEDHITKDNDIKYKNK